MVNSCFVVINAAHNNGHGKSILLVSSLSVLIVLLVVAAIVVAVHMDGQGKVSLHFQSCLPMSTPFNQSFISLQSQTLSSYANCT